MHRDVKPLNILIDHAERKVSGGFSLVGRFGVLGRGDRLVLGWGGLRWERGEDGGRERSLRGGGWTEETREKEVLTILMFSDKTVEVNRLGSSRVLPPRSRVKRSRR